MANSKLKKTPIGDYEVGYCRPPQAHRFRQGEVHNRRGRPRRKPTFDDHLSKVLMEPITIKVGGEMRTVTKAEAVVYRLLELSAKSTRASRRVTEILRKLDREQVKTENPSYSGVVVMPDYRAEMYRRRVAEELERNPYVDLDEAKDRAAKAAVEADEARIAAEEAEYKKAD